MKITHECQKVLNISQNGEKSKILSLLPVVYTVFFFWINVGILYVIRKSSKNWVDLEVGEADLTTGSRDTGPWKSKKRRGSMLFFGVRFKYANDSSFERARRVESNETRINVFGRFWTKLYPKVLLQSQPWRRSGLVSWFEKNGRWSWLVRYLIHYQKSPK